MGEIILKELFVCFPQSCTHVDLLSRNLLDLAMRMLLPQRRYDPSEMSTVCLIGTLSTVLQHFTTHNETLWPTTACPCYFLLRDVSFRQSWHLSTTCHPQVPPEWPYCQQAQCKHWFTVWWRIADLLTSSHPQMSDSNMYGLQGPQQSPAWASYFFACLLFWLSVQAFPCNRIFRRFSENLRHHKFVLRLSDL